MDGIERVSGVVEGGDDECSAAVAVADFVEGVGLAWSVSDAECSEVVVGFSWV